MANFVGGIFFDNILSNILLQNTIYCMEEDDFSAHFKCPHSGPRILSANQNLSVSD